MLNITISDMWKKLFKKSSFITCKCSESQKDIFGIFFSANLTLHSAKNVQLETNSLIYISIILIYIVCLFCNTPFGTIWPIFIPCIHLASFVLNMTIVIKICTKNICTIIWSCINHLVWKWILLEWTGINRNMCQLKASWQMHLDITHDTSHSNILARKLEKTWFSKECKDER